MRGKSEVGKIGEQIACEYLRDKGWRILGRNLLEFRGEIDVLAYDRQKTLVFVEVKTLQGAGGDFKPEDNFNFAKKRKSIRAAQLFVGYHPDLVNDDRGWRIDLLAVRILNPLLTDWKKDCEINHYENVISS